VFGGLGAGITEQRVCEVHDAVGAMRATVPRIALCLGRAPRSASAAITSQSGVDDFAACCPLFVDSFSRLAGHALLPPQHRFTVTWLGFQFRPWLAGSLDA
jgi:hypothetical protein